MPSPFDTRAATWDADPRRLRLAADIFSALDRAVPLHPGMNALDYGAGTGLLTLALAPRVRHILAVDSSPGMLDVLQHKIRAAGLPHVETLRADFTSDPLPPGPFDLIASAMTLHHVADLAALLHQFHRLLAPGGSLALVDLDPEDGSFHAHATGIPHHGFDHAAFAQLLADAGFTAIRFEPAARIEKNARVYTAFLATARPGTIAINEDFIIDRSP